MMRTRIDIRDTLIENARSTVEAEINPPAPLKCWFIYGGAMTSTYMDYETGLAEFMRDICKNPQYVKRLEIRIELEEEGVKGDAET